MMKKLKGIKWFNVILFLFVMVGLLVLAQFFVRPNMEGWDVERVLHYEAANDINIIYDYIYSDEVDYGIVVDQQKCENEETCDVKLTISKGRDVSKNTETEIRAYLDELIATGLITANEVNYHDSMYSNDVKPGFAVYYEPDPIKQCIDISFSLGPEIRVYKASMVAVGDILLHDTVFNDFRLEGDLFDFSPLLENVKSYIEPADFAFANQESNIGGIEIGLSSYPNFNSPYEIVRDLVGIGFNMFSRANNHTLDKGENGVILAESYWQTLNGIISAGSTDSQEKRDQIPVIEQNGIRLALLAYSYGFNGYRVPEDKPYLANEFSYEQAEQDIQKAKEVADVIVVSMHWGTEYQDTPNETQLEQAKWLADQGVNVILGEHPHVLQPVDILVGRDGNETLVAYSLGNFISGQTGLAKLVGGILKFDIIKTTIGDEVKIEISQPQLMPTYNYAENGTVNYQLVPLVESDQRDYFETVQALMENYSNVVDVVDYITYDEN